MNKMKRAQVEIMGLMVIVILASIALIFGFIFSANNQSSSTTQEQFSDLQTVATFTPTLLSSSSNCTDNNNNYLSVKDLLDICITSRAFQCRAMDNVGACEAMNNSIETILNETMDLWGVNYWFNLNLDGNLTNFDVNRCSEFRRNFIMEPLVIPTQRGPVRATLKLC